MLKKHQRLDTPQRFGTNPQARAPRQLNPRFARRLHYAVLLLGALLTGSVQAQTTWYVDDDADPNGVGSTWATAFEHLQDALAVATPADEIRVAGGTYRPDEDTNDPNGTDDRNATFQLISGVAIYGGYAGLADPNDPNARDIQLYETILSGDLDANDLPNFENNGENSYHVVTGSGTDATAVLDGFTVTAGNANNGTWGGGMLNQGGNPTVANCTFSGNYANGGGGMCNRNGSSPTVTDCTFSGNKASSGGGMTVEPYDNASSPTLTRCTFSDNAAEGGYGGGLSIRWGNSTLTDCTFTGNSADALGGGIFMWEGTGTIFMTGCVFSGNSANSAGGGIANVSLGGGNLVLIACTFTANTGGSGGGISVKNTSTVINCEFNGNSAVVAGGGIENQGSMTVINSSFSGNSVPSPDPNGDYGGGAIHNSAETDLEVVNCTFGGNSATAFGGGIHNDGPATLTSSIFWANTDGHSTVEHAQIYDGQGTSSVTYSLIQGLVPGGGFDDGTNIDGDPLFVDADGVDDIVGTEDDDLRLSAGSPAIDAANNTAVPADDYDLDGNGNSTEQIPIDLIGNPRFVDDLATPDTGVPSPEHTEIVDMGAFEYQGGDCNGNGIQDVCELDCGETGGPCDVPGCGESADCNGNGVLDECDIAAGISLDLDGNGIPDECLRFVDADAAPGGDGLSWATAYDHLQDALAEADSDPLINQLWVAEGTYMPDGGLVRVGGELIPGTYDRDATFQLLNEVAIYGGFAGDESDLEERDVEANETILNGDLYDNDLPDYANYQENSYHVVTGNGVDATAVLDGVTIRAGYADYEYYPNNMGGGALIDNGSPVIVKCRLIDNWSYNDGAGLANVYGSASSVIDCTFAGNNANAGGGMAVMFNATANLSGCAFNGNTTHNWAGGGLIIRYSSYATLTDCVFTNNTAAWYGGGMSVQQCVIPATQLTRCVFENNHATNSGGGGLQLDQSSAILTECQFIENCADHSGGGIEVNAGGGPITLINGDLRGNSAGTYGGGIRNTGDLEIINGNFSGNSVSSDGGGAGGGAIYNWGADHPGDLTVINCTFSENTTNAFGGAIRNAGTSLFIRNSLFWANTDSGSGAEESQIRDYSDPNTVDVAYTLIQGLILGGQFDNGTNIDGDPLFVDADGADDIVGTDDDDLRLFAGSPAIDAADNTAVPADDYDLDDDGNETERTPWDLRENRRFVDDPATDPDTGNPDPNDPNLPIVDMGAYEHQPTDCNGNDIPDVCDIDPDCHDPNSPCYEYDPNCGESADLNGNGIPDECDPDCDGDGFPDDYEIANCDPNDPTCADCNGNGVPDECDIDPNDPDGNGEVSDDCQPNEIPDECDRDPDDGLVISRWIGGAGEWNWTCIPPVDPNCTPHWCPDAIPSNGGGKTFSVSVLDPAAVITLDVSPTIDDLSVAGIDPNNAATVVVSDGSGAAVRSLVVTGTIINSGVFEATDGKRFLLDAPAVDQTGGGTLLATDGTADPNELSVLEINGSYVTGGFARTEGVRSEIHLIGGAVLDGVTIDGVVVPDGQLGSFNSTITNGSTFDVAPGGSAVTMLSPGPDNAALEGDGGRVLLGGEWVALLGSFEAPFTNRDGHTIEGAGVIFGGMTNEGTIRADLGAEDPNDPDDAQAIILSPPAAKVNNGTFVATNGGILDIQADITGDGNIEASDAGQVLIDGVTVQNYSLTVPGGTITVVTAFVGFANGVDLPPDGTNRSGGLEVSGSTFNGVDWLFVSDGIVTLSAGSDVTISDGPVVLCPDTGSDPAPVAELRIDDPDSTLAAVGLEVCADGVLDVAGTITLTTGSFTFANTEESNWWWWDDPNTPATLEMLGGAGVADHDPNSYVQLEIGGEDLGDDPNDHIGDPNGFANNFDLSELVIGPGAHVSLVDLVDNGNRNGVGGAAEALYVDRLTFADSDGRLNLNELHLYYATLVGDSSQILDRAPLFGDLNDDCLVGLADLAQLLSNYGTASGASYEDGDLDVDGDVDVADLAALLAVYGTICR